MSGDGSLSLEVPSDPRYLCAVRDFVSQAARAIGFHEGQCAQVALAVDEAITNVIKHGYLGATDRRVWLRLEVQAPDGRGPGLRIIIEDEGRQVDPSQIRGRDLDDIRPGGLGVHIIREVMDSVEYAHRDGCGMRLTMAKRQGSPASPPAPGECSKGGGG